MTTELPMVILDVQRGGPSTGLPTKTEQSDLFISVLGRNGDCPVPVVAAQSPADCFTMAQEAMRIAVGHMTPVFLLTDGYIANGAEPWLIPQIADLKPIPVAHPTAPNANGKGYLPYLRDERLVRPWALPGTRGLEHRLGGLEKSDVTGNVDYDPFNHQHMVQTRQRKVDLIADDIPEQDVFNVRFEGAPYVDEPPLPARLRTIAPIDTSAATARSIELTQSLPDGKLVLGINGVPSWDADPLHGHIGDTEVWTVSNDMDWDHPFHLHGFFFQVLEVNGKPPAFLSWEDTVNIPAKGRVRIAWRPDDRPGEWMYHCHILEHHAAGMMGHFEVVA